MNANGKRRIGSTRSFRGRVWHGPALLQLQNGQALLEVALVTPLLLLLLVGTIELGRYAYFGILVGNAARAGAAYGAQSLTQSAETQDICNAASNDFQGSTAVPCSGTTSSGSNGTITITSSTSCGCDSGGTITAAGCTTDVNPNAGTCATGHWAVMVSVQAAGTFSPLFNYPGVSKAFTVSRTSTMRVAND